MKDAPLPDFDLIIATRNRPEALRMSIPFILAQSVRPRRLIVVDSSDDHEMICRTVEQSTAGFTGRLEIVKAPRGLTRQRNIGLRHVEEEIVFFPDDDSMFHPDTTENILRVYRLDKNKAVGGVCAAEAMSMPATDAAVADYSSSKLDLLKKRLIRTKRHFERRFAPDPFLTLGQEFIATRSAPRWLEQENAVLVETMTGFRMTYRTESIIRHGFNEAFVEYGLYEDTDASFKVLKDQHLVGARNARIHHRRFPGARANGRSMGIANVLNRAWVIARHAPRGSAARTQLQHYCNYTVLRYLLGANDVFGRDRVKGAYDALGGARALMNCEPAKLDETYKHFWEQYTSVAR